MEAQHAKKKLAAFTIQVNTLLQRQREVRIEIKDAEEQAQVQSNLANYLAENDMSYNERVTVGMHGMAPGFNPGN